MILSKTKSPRADSYDMLVAGFVSVLILLPGVLFIEFVFKVHPPFFDWVVYGSVGITLFASIMAVTKASSRWAKIAFFGALLPYISLLLLLVGFFLLAIIVGGQGSGLW
jgi:hypothetical protein